MSEQPLTVPAPKPLLVLEPQQPTDIRRLARLLAALDAPEPDEPPALPEAMVDAVRALGAEVAARRDTLPYEGQRRIIEALNVQVTLGHQDGKKEIKIASILGVDTVPVP